MMSAGLPAIPVVDVREGGPLRHAQVSCTRARALRDDCLAWFPRALGPWMQALDGIARRWLKRSRSPYVGEIEAIAAALGFPGVWFLNASYQWGCTTLAREETGAPWLLRTLDWPFPGLGRHVEVARMRGEAGEFFSVTWPGYAGILTALAPHRFAAAVNQAPLWRRMRQAWLRPYDLAANALGTWRIRHIPPDQLLRQAFEACTSFAAARCLLEITPVARPVIYTLIGCLPGERCVIERTEESFSTREDDTCAANDWFPCRLGWEARIGGDMLLSCSSADAAENSRARRDALAGWGGGSAGTEFAWVTPPVLNPFTRIAVEMCPAAAALRVVGYEQPATGDLPQPVTQICEVGSDAPTQVGALAH